MLVAKGGALQAGCSHARGLAQPIWCGQAQAHPHPGAALLGAQHPTGILRSDRRQWGAEAGSMAESGAGIRLNLPLHPTPNRCPVTPERGAPATWGRTPACLAGPGGPPLGARPLPPLCRPTEGAVHQAVPT